MIDDLQRIFTALGGATDVADAIGRIETLRQNACRANTLALANASLNARALNAARYAARLKVAADAIDKPGARAWAAKVLEALEPSPAPTPPAPALANPPRDLVHLGEEPRVERGAGLMPLDGPVHERQHVAVRPAVAGDADRGEVGGGGVHGVDGARQCSEGIQRTAGGAGRGE